MLKNKIILALSLAIVLSPVVIHAEETVTTQANPPIKVNINDKARIEELKTKLMKETEALKDKFAIRKAEIQKKIEAKKDEVKKKIELKQQEKVRTLLNNVFTKLNTKLNKLNDIDKKLSAKISEIEKSGKNVTEMKAQYVVAKEALNKATADLLATKQLSETQITSETTRGSFRTLVKTAEDSLKSAASEYKKLIPMIAVTNSDDESNKVEGKTETETETDKTN